MAECCVKFRYRFTQFKAVFYHMKAGHMRDSAPQFINVQRAGLETYQRAFLERCER
jgi:hypothetical protein